MHSTPRSGGPQANRAHRNARNATLREVPRPVRARYRVLMNLKVAADGRRFLHLRMDPRILA